GGAPVQHSFTVRNDGGSTLTTSGLVLPSGFSLRSGERRVGEASGSGTLTGQLDTNSTGKKSGHSSFATKDSDEKPFNFSITGTVNTAVAPPEITVLGNSVSIANSESDPSMSDVSDFGSVPQGGAPVQHSFTVRNDGGSTLTTSGLVLPSGFSL